MGTYCDFVVSIEIKSFTMKTPIISMNLPTKSHCRLTHRVNGGGSKEIKICLSTATISPIYKRHNSYLNLVKF